MLSKDTAALDESISAARSASSLSRLTRGLGLVGAEDETVVVEPWTVASIAARRATGDVLVTRKDWSVSFDTSSETGKVATLTCRRYAPGISLEVVEYDIADGDVFDTVDDAECYALNAGRLWWFSEYKVQKAVR